VDGRHHHAQLFGELLAERSDTVEECAASRCVDETDKLVSDLQREQIKSERSVHFGCRALGIVGCFGLCGLRRQSRWTIALLANDKEETTGEHQARNRRHARHERQDRQDSGGHDDRPPTPEELSAECSTELVSGRAPRHDDAGSGGDQERRDLRGERVSHAQDGERLARFGDVHAARHAENQPAYQVDGRNEQSGD
jgi:hypothetical protein